MWVTLVVLGSNSFGQPPLLQSRAKRPVWQPDAERKILGEETEYESLLDQLDSRNASKTVVSQVPLRTDGRESSSKTLGEIGVSRETLENEIKAQAKRLQAALPHASGFAAGGFKEARSVFAWLATLLGAVEEFPSEVRWKNSAPLARARFSALARQLRTGNDKEFALAKEGRETLTELLNGAGQTNTTSAKPVPWGEIVVRTSTMQRMQDALETDLSRGMANPKEFKKRELQLRYAAEILSLCAVLLAKPGVEGTDDQDYVLLADNLREGAIELGAGIRTDEYERARAALGKVSQDCEKCHEAYR